MISVEESSSMETTEAAIAAAQAANVGQQKATYYTNTSMQYMTPEQFCYWLQGYSELTGDSRPTNEQWALIQQHLACVFRSVIPGILGQLGNPNSVHAPFLC